ncbi:MAG: glycosyltransferase family 2 protein [Eubacterium sp.]|nr:glycosyltransferase family 2 protein [Eubacterium sp.]
MESLYLVMPAYNEEENIEKTIRDWYPIVEARGEDSRLVVADSGSEDNTHNILVKLQQECPKLEILSDTEKQHGPKVIALYKYAIKKNADYIFQTDSDGQTDPKEFDDAWNLKSEYDGVFGHRKVRGDGKSREKVEKVIAILLKVIFGIKIPDANAPFRLMKTSVVGKYINNLNDDYEIPNIMMTTYFVYYKEKNCFIPVSFSARKAGKNSINILKIMKIGFRSVIDFIGFRRKMKKER